MAEMGSAERKLWKERLEFADFIWKDHGLTGDSQNSAVLRWMEMYRGNQWNSTGLTGWGGETVEQITVNYIFSLVNTMIAQLSARHPIIDVTPAFPDAAQNARAMELLINNLIRSRKLRAKRQWNRVLLDAAICGFGILRHGFTPSEEFYDRKDNRLEAFAPARPDLPWVRRWAPWDVRIDPEAEVMDPDGDARWSAFRVLRAVEEFTKNPNLIKRADLKPTISVDKRETRPTMDLDPLSPDWNQKVECWVVFDRMERKWFELAVCCELPVRLPEDWPIDWEHMPYNFLAFNEAPDDMIPVSPLSQIEEQQIELNKTRTLANELIKRMRRLVFVFGDGLEDTSRNRLFNDYGTDLVEILETTGAPKDVMAQASVGGGIGELLMHATQLREDMRETLGQGRFDRGQRENVDTATEAQRIAVGSDIQTGRNKAPFEEFLSDAVATFGQALQSEGVLTESIAIPLVGIRDATLLFQAGQLDASSLTVQPQDIRGEFIYEIRPGSTAPRNPNEEIARALQATQLAERFSADMNVRQTLIDTLIALGQDPDRMLNPPKMTAEIAAAQQAQPAAPQPQSQPPDPRAFLQGRGGNGAQ